MSQPEPTAPLAKVETSKSHRQFAWMAIALGIIPLVIAVVLAVVYGLWIPLVVIAIGDIFTVRTVIKEFEAAARLEAEGR